MGWFVEVDDAACAWTCGVESSCFHLGQDATCPEARSAASSTCFRLIVLGFGCFSSMLTLLVAHLVMILAALPKNLRRSNLSLDVGAGIKRETGPGVLPWLPVHSLAVGPLFLPHYGASAPESQREACPLFRG